MDDVVYLDHAATTPVRAEVVEAMLPFLTHRWANPSGSYRFGRDARRAVDEARDVVAEMVGCRAGEVIFTSGGTEADNLAVAGLGRHGARGPWCSAVEHHAVLEPVARAGGHVVAVDRRGHVDVDRLGAELNGGPASGPGLVSVMAVNNEVGTVTDLAAVAAAVRRSPGTVLHTDAVQAACWLDLRDVFARVDALSLSAHKFGGPKGIGALVVRAGVALDPLIVGGGQERDRRSGTPHVAGIVGMAVALRLTDAEREAEVARVGPLRDRLVDELAARVGGVHEIVPRPAKIAGSAHVCIEGVENEALLFLLDEAGVCASAAAACASGAMEPSHVLAAMQVEPALARGAVRFTLGRTTTGADVDRAVTATVAAVDRLRSSGRS
jgi:cysteine desulfurase